MVKRHIVIRISGVFLMNKNANKYNELHKTEIIILFKIGPKTNKHLRVFRHNRSTNTYSQSTKN